MPGVNLKYYQIHISKEGINSEGEVYDAHELPSDMETKKIFDFIAKYNTIKYVTVEYYKDSSKLIAYLNKLNSMI